MFAAQRRLAGREAPDDAMVRIALDALFEAHGRLPLASFAKRLGVTAPRTRRTIAGLQRLLNVDGYPVLRLDEERERIELDGALLVRQLELEP